MSRRLSWATVLMTMAIIAGACSSPAASTAPSAAASAESPAASASTEPSASGGGSAAAADCAGVGTSGGSGEPQIPEVEAGKFNVAMVLLGPHDDGGWSQAHYEGLQYLCQNVADAHV